MKHPSLSPCQAILAVTPQEKHKTVQVLRLFSFSAQRWQKQRQVTTLPGASHVKTHKQQLGTENDLQQRWHPLAPRERHWFPPQEDLAHPTQHGGRNQNTHPLDGWSSSHHLPVWSRIIFQTPAAASSVLMGTLVIVLQTAWRMWDVAEGKTIATSFAQIIWGLLYVRASTMRSVFVKQ